MKNLKLPCGYSCKLGGLIITIVLTLLICLFGYQKYVFGGYIWFGAASDTMIVILPTIIEMHYQIYENSSILWSFYQGMGLPIFTENPNMHGDIFAWLLALLPVEIIPQGLIYVHILKFIIASSLFYIYLCEFKTLTIYTRIIGSLCYACSGVMLCRGAWWHYATEVVMLVPFLIGLEKWHRNHKSLFIIPAFAALLVSRYATYVYIYTLYAWGYLMLRHYLRQKFSIFNCALLIKSFLPYYVVSLCLAAVFVLPGILHFFSSSRISNLLHEEGLNIFYLQNVTTITANFLKFFQPNITGMLNTGVDNVLADFCGYSSILVLIICINMLWNKNQNKFFKLFIFAVFIYSIWNLPVFILNAFAYSSTKTSSIWVNVSLILIGMYFMEKSSFSLKIQNNFALIILFAVLAYIYQWICGLLIITEVYWAIALLITYNGILFFYQKKNKVMRILLIAIVCMESCISVYFSSYQPDYMEYYSQQNVWQETFNRNVTVETNNEFQRIAMLNKHIVLTSDESLNRYYGFDEYVSVNPKYIIKFADTFNAGFLRPVPTFKTQYVLGLERYHGIRNMLSAAYIGDARTNTFIKNEDFVPLGYLYDLQISEGELKNYPVNIRDDIFSKAAILDTPVDSINNYEDFYSVNKLQEQSLSIVDTNCLQNEAGADTHVITGDDPFIIYAVNNVKASGEEIISLEPDITVFNKEGKQIQDLPVQIFYAGEDRIFSEENSFYSSIRNGQLQIYLSDDINASNVKFIRIDLGSKEQRLGIGDVKLCTYKVSLKTAAPQQEYIPYVPLNRNSVCQQESFSDTEIHLRATTDAPKVLFLSIPYDKGWSIYDNGKELDVMHVNIGFIGAYLEPGEHELLVKYRTPGLYEGAAISGITALILLFVWFKRRRNCPAR